MSRNDPPDDDDDDDIELPSPMQRALQNAGGRADVVRSIYLGLARNHDELLDLLTEMLNAARRVHDYETASNLAELVRIVCDMGDARMEWEGKSS